MIPHEDIEAFVKVFRDAPRLAELELKVEGDGILRLRRSLASAERPKQAPKKRVVAPSPEPVAAPTPEVVPAGTMVTSTLVGVFRAATRETITEESVVRVGQILGFIEAMRLMNEVTAPQAGRVRAIYVQDGQPVEYGQPLFELDPIETVEE